MMKTFLCILFLASLTFGCKRSATPTRRSERLASKRQKIEQDTEMVTEALEIPDDIVNHIAAMALDHITTRDPNSSPGANLSLVSKQWKKATESHYFKQAMRNNPKSALWLLAQEKFDLSGGKNMDLLIAAKDLLNHEERLNMILNADSLDVLKILGDLEDWLLISAADYLTAHRVIARNQIQLREFQDIGPAIVHPAFSHLFWYPFELSDGMHPENHILFRLPTHQLVKILFIEDLYAPYEMTFIFKFVIEELTRMYHQYPSHHWMITEFMQSMNELSLPKLKVSIVGEMFQWSMLLAFLCGDRKFFSVMSFDFDAIISRQKTLHYSTGMHTLFQKFVNGEIDDIPTDYRQLVTWEIERGAPLRYQGFDRQLLRQKFDQLVQWNPHNTRLPRAIRMYLF